MGKSFNLTTRAIVLILIIGLTLGGAVYVFHKKPGEGTCENVPQLPDAASKMVTKVIDGDTFLIEGGYSVRMLGIDADERDHTCYASAKDRLEELILNKDVRLEKGTEDKDQWCRYLRYIWVGDTNISLTLVKEGLAVTRFSPEDVKYREHITQAEKEARERQTGCKWSPAAATTQEKSVPEKYYANKTARVRGEVKEYQGRPEIIVKDPSQMEVGK